MVHDWNWADNYAWARNEVDTELPGSARSTQTGYEVGARIGYDWQRGCTLFGGRGLGAGRTRAQRATSPMGRGAANIDQLLVRGKLDWYGTVRARTGIVVDSVLLYTTGSFAYARRAGRPR